MALWKSSVPYIVISGFCYRRHHKLETEFASRWCLRTKPLTVKRSLEPALLSGIGSCRNNICLGFTDWFRFVCLLAWSSVKRPLCPLLLPHRWSTTCASPTRHALPRPESAPAWAPTATWTGTRSASSPSSRCRGQESSKAIWGARQVIWPHDVFFFRERNYFL